MRELTKAEVEYLIELVSISGGEWFTLFIEGGNDEPAASEADAVLDVLDELERKLRNGVIEGITYTPEGGIPTSLKAVKAASYK